VSCPSMLEAAVLEHLREMEASGYSPATLDGRRRHLVEFAAWCEARGVTHPPEISPELLERYRRTLYHHRQEDGRALSWATQAGKLSSVKQLCRWMARTRRVLYNPAADLALPRQPRRIPGSVLSVDEAEAVLAQPDLSLLTGLRDRAVLEVLYSTGIRRMELVNLDVADLDAERGTLLVRQGKGRKDRYVPIGERAIHWTGRYLEEVRPRFSRLPDPGALFLTSRGGRLAANRLTERLHRYLAEAGVGKPGACHVWRHTTATLMLEGGADVRDIQEMLGHADLSTTQIYTHVSIRRLQEVHARTHPARLTRAAGEGH
jgi:integrase/recombinase XerD